MANEMLPDHPSEMKLMELALRLPREFGLTDAQVSSLQVLSADLQSVLIECSSSLRKAELNLPSDVDLGERDYAEGPIREAFAATAAARVGANVELRRILLPVQYRRLADTLNPANRAHPRIAGLAVPANEDTAKDQKVVEIETAVLVAERVMSWTKLFAGVVVVPLTLFLATLAVLGFSKYSDFTTFVRQSEDKLRSNVAQSTTNAELLAKRVAELAQNQSESDRQIVTLASELNSVKEKLGFSEGTGLALTAQKRLQGLFAKFQQYVIGLGYSPGESEIKLSILADDAAGNLAYYTNNTIFVAKSAADDQEVVYREYLHHVLYSKVGISTIGPERSALESGLADYLVASYADSPRIYRRSLGAGINLDQVEKLRPARGHEDRFPVGQIWSSLFWELRKVLGRQTTDRMLLGAWFELNVELPDKSIPVEMSTRFLARAAHSPGSPERGRLAAIFRTRGAPLP